MTRNDPSDTTSAHVVPTARSSQGPSLAGGQPRFRAGPLGCDRGGDDLN
jgi:hypothetical protein